MIKKVLNILKYIKAHSIWWIEYLQQISPSQILITLENSQTHILDIFTKEISH